MRLTLVLVAVLGAAPAWAQVQVVAGSYGLNCGAKAGNKTDHLARTCHGQAQCRYKVDLTVIGDPAPGCGKTYVAEWRCGSGGQVLRAEAAAEAGFGSVLELSCGEPPVGTGINVVAGSYGANCGAKTGNKTEPLARACNGQESCRYKIDQTVLGDPAPGCGKTYVAEWRCGSGRGVFRTEAAAEAGFGSVIELSCGPEQQAPQSGGPEIQVVAGSYGVNCGAQAGNKTDHLAKACTGHTSCRYKVDHTVLGDPAAGCGKTYVAEWRCGNGGQVFRAEAAAEAGFGSVVELTCQGQQPAPLPPGQGIRVLAGTYGGNCRQPQGNKTDFLAKACNGRARCDYVIDRQALGEPAQGCPKDYFAQWQCGSAPEIYSVTVPPEAGFQKVARLLCP